MFLARTWLHCTPFEFDRRVTRPELLSMIAQYSAEPWGELRADIAAGRICAVVAAAHSTRRSFKASDFVYDYEAQYRPPQTQEDMMAAAMKATRLFGGEVR